MTGLGSRRRDRTDRAPKWHRLSAVQQSAYIAWEALATGLRMSQNVRFRAVQRAREEFAMIGLVLVTHGRLAEEFRSALEHVVGPQRRRDDHHRPRGRHGARRNDIVAAVKRVDTGDGVIILTDMFGGTPSNLAISVMSSPRSKWWPASTCRCWSSSPESATNCPLEEAVAAAQEAGRKYITVASQVLAGK